MKKIAGVIVTLGALTASPSAAQASSVGTTMGVGVTTLNSCAVVASPLGFGIVTQVSGTNIDSSTTIIVTCTPGTVYNVGLDNGAHAASGVRQMQAATGTALIPYNVYQDSTRLTAWGNTVGTDTVTKTATLLPMTLQVYGRIPGSAAVQSAGIYADTVNVTVTF